MKHTMKLLKSPFDNIKNGSKTIEFRLYDEKRKQVQIGDTIEFSCLPDLTEKISVKVLDLYKASSFKELFQNLNFENPDEKAERMHKIYTPEEELKFGVLGIKIELM